MTVGSVDFRGFMPDTSVFNLRLMTVFYTVYIFATNKYGYYEDIESSKSCRSASSWHQNKQNKLGGIWITTGRGLLILVGEPVEEKGAC